MGHRGCKGGDGTESRSKSFSSSTVSGSTRSDMCSKISENAKRTEKKDNEKIRGPSSTAQWRRRVAETLVAELKVYQRQPCTSDGGTAVAEPILRTSPSHAATKTHTAPKFKTVNASGYGSTSQDSVRGQSHQSGNSDAVPASTHKTSARNGEGSVKDVSGDFGYKGRGVCE